MDIIYKRKDQKVKLVNFNKLDGIKLGGYTDQKKKIIKITQIQDFDTDDG